MEVYTMDEWELRELSDEELQAEAERAKKLKEAYWEDFIGLDYMKWQGKVKAEIALREELKGKNCPNVKDLDVYMARERIEVLRELVKRLSEDNNQYKAAFKSVNWNLKRLGQKYTNFRYLKEPEWDEGEVNCAYFNEDNELCVQYKSGHTWHYVYDEEDGLTWWKRDWE